MNKITMLFLVSAFVASTSVVGRSRGRSAASRVRKNVSGRHKKQSLRGEIYAHGLDALPSFYVFWAGRFVKSDENGFYHLPLEDKEDRERLKSDSFSIMICKEVEPETMQSNTVQRLVIKNKKRCLWYDIDREYDEKKKLWYWHPTEKKIDEAKPFVPDNCVLILLNTKYIDKDQLEQSMRSTRQTDEYEYVLPRITLNKFIEQHPERLALQAENRAIGSALDLARWHAPVKRASSHQGNVDIQNPY